MRELTASRPQTGQTFATDEKSSDGANHHYAFSYKPSIDGPPVPMGEIKFQNGPVSEAGINGISDEQVLQVLIDHVDGLAHGRIFVDQNQQAVLDLKQARSWLESRPASPPHLGAAKQ